MAGAKKIKVYIFVTCLVDNLFPEVGESMVRVLERQGVEVEFLSEQTCCGQPAYNSGYRGEAFSVASRFIEAFDRAMARDTGKESYVVCPSGSCTAMIKIFYKELFESDSYRLGVAERVMSRTHEFSDFLVNVLGVEDVGASFEGAVTYHDSCHLLRELGMEGEPRKLINAVRGIELVEMDMHDACCGFGGTFAIKFPKVSVSMLEEKMSSIINTGAGVVVAGDMGCLMNIDGLIKRKKLNIKTMHLAELLDSGHKS